MENQKVEVKKNITPEYTLRAVRKYAKVHRNKINEYRKRIYFIKYVETMLEEEDMTKDEKLYFITIKKNYDVYKEDPVIISLLSPLIT
jgi:hypothetical protein